MKTNKHKSLKLVMGLLAPLVLTTACTEERPYDELPKGIDQTEVSTSMVGNCKAEDIYMYLPSTVETSRSTSATRPHWMGDPKLVTLKCDKDTLSVVQVEKEGEFSDNPTNHLPVLSIPVEFVDYRCAADADGKCTQKEEENKDIPWNQKKYVRVDFSGMEVKEVNTLPEQLGNLGYKCFDKVSDTIVAAKIEEDAINITVESDFQTNVQCSDIRSIDDLAELGFKVRNHYSLVKLNSLVTPGYQALNYPAGEESTFGFFNTESDKLDVDNNDTLLGEKTFVNRWAPNKNVKYHLSESFLKAGNEKLIAHTKKAVATINTSLQKAGAEMQIELIDPTEGLSTGDLRVNSIVLEDDPLAMSVIGYGPTAANPLTGEILHGRTVMYLGSIKKYLYRTYDEFVDKKIAEATAAEAAGLDSSDNVEPSAEIKVAGAMATQAFDSVSSALVGSKSKSKSFGSMSGGFGSVSEKQLADAVMNPLNQQVMASDLKSELEDDLSHTHLHQDFLLSKNCFFTEDMIGDAELQKEIEDLVAQLGLKKWQDLSESEKQLVVDTMTPFVWVPVLVHELGHNLGLRHNFAGSEDKDNFYSKAELSEMGIHRDITYSSVMDYTYSTVNELPVMGKYDVAALRFGYAEKVELADGSLISLAEFRDPQFAASGKTLKAYEFCTDEHVAVNPNCNRFDEGTNLTEIAEHMVKAYHESYTKNNFRNLRKNFSVFDDPSHTSRLLRTFGGLRVFLERYESIKNDFNLGNDHALWTSNEFLKDLKQATIVAGKFMVEVLKTPDLMCAISQKSNPSQLVALVPIQQLSASAADCFDSENIGLNDQYVIVGKAGKLFQSKKDPRSEGRHKTYADQVDVRGIWIDKVLALHGLVGRKSNISNFNKYRESFMDLPEVAEEADSVLRAILMDQTVTKVDIELATGQTVSVDFPVSMFSKVPGQNGHRIIDPLNPIMTRYFGLPEGNPSFQKIVQKDLLALLPSQDQVTDQTSLLNAISFGKASATDNVPGIDQGYVSTRIGQTTFYAPVTNQVAASHIQLSQITGVLEKVGKDRVKEIAEKKKKKEKLKEGSKKEEQDAYEMSDDVLDAFINDQLQAKDFYDQSLLSI